MLKYLAFSMFVALVLGVTVRELWYQDSDESIDLSYVLAHDQQTREVVASHQRFRAVLQPTLDYLATGDLPLAEASWRVHEAARLDAPSYLRVLPRSDPGKTIYESVARNLIGHLRDRLTYEPQLASRIVAIEDELQAILCEFEQHEAAGIAH